MITVRAREKEAKNREAERRLLRFPTLGDVPPSSRLDRCVGYVVRSLPHRDLPG
jgi:hypothetical protein